MKIKHIDHGFYRLTAPQAKALCIDNVLPRWGYEKLAAIPADLVLLHRAPHQGDWKPSDAKPTKGWIIRTRLTLFDGAPVTAGWSWAIRFSSI